MSHVHNFSESAIRKRIIIIKRMIFLSKKKMRWGFFSTMTKSAILNHVEGKRKREKKKKVKLSVNIIFLKVNLKFK